MLASVLLDLPLLNSPPFQLDEIPLSGPLASCSSLAQSDPNWQCPPVVGSPKMLVRGLAYHTLTVLAALNASSEHAPEDAPIIPLPVAQGPGCSFVDRAGLQAGITFTTVFRCPFKRQKLQFPHIVGRHQAG
jgi:hypothetical protein